MNIGQGVNWQSDNVRKEVTSAWHQVLKHQKLVCSVSNHRCDDFVCARLASINYLSITEVHNKSLFHLPIWEW